MKYALIGCGRISAKHIEAARQAELEITALCDVVPESMEKIVSRNPDLRNSARYTDYRALLAEMKPDLTAIATDSGSHAEIALAAISAGSNVIIEKPIALSLDDADKINGLAASRGVKVCSCHQNRFNSSIQHIRRAIDSGRFGRLSHGAVAVRWSRDKNYYAQADWRGTWARDGGALMNQSIHGLDLLRWLMGDDIDEVFGYTRKAFHPYLECEDLGMAAVKFKSGALGTMEGSTNVFPADLEETLHLFGEKGTAKAGGLAANNIEIWNFQDAGPEEPSPAGGLKENVSDVYGKGHKALYADTAAAIRENRPPYIDGQAGRRALELVLAIYQSAAEGRPVKLPLAGGSTSDFTGMFSG